jgi:Mitochondrial carrier protein
MASVISVTACFPLEVLKTRMQIQVSLELNGRQIRYRCYIHIFINFFDTSAILKLH